MADLPTLVYRVPGAHRLNGSQTYDWLGVTDAEALSSALEVGWSETLGEAQEISSIPKTRRKATDGQ